MELTKRSKSCTISTCCNFIGTRDPKFGFFRPPKSGLRRQNWIKSIEKNSDNISSQYQVCNLHFQNNDLQFINGKLSLHNDAIPTIFNRNESVENNGEQSDTNGAEEIDDVTPGLQPHESHQSELKKRLDMEIKLIKAEEKIKILEKKYNVMDEKNKQLKTEIARLKQDERNYKNKLFSKLSDDAKTLVNRLIGGTNSKYCPVVRSFAITLQSYSTKAYEFLRKKFNDNLPHIGTIRKWYSNSIGKDPGITGETIAHLKHLVSERHQQDKPLMVSLTFDEMAIRRHVQWVDSCKQFFGFITVGEKDDDGNLPVASQALVFLVNGINQNLSLPVAYYHVNYLKAADKRDLLLKVIEAITSTGVKLCNITFDGLVTNFSMCTLLGASFDLNDPKTYFINPFDGNKVFIMLDACHMLKLMRNYIGKSDLRDDNKRIISWKFFESLEKYRVKDSFVAHKLTKKHIAWEQSKMNVPLAAQTLSDSVANSMEFLMKNGTKAFEHCEGTIHFVRIANKLFDIFNSTKVNDEKRTKSPLTHHTIQSTFVFLHEVSEYLKKLRINGQLLIESNLKTGFKGFVLDILSLHGIYEEFLEGDDFSLSTFSLSQDPLESFFGRIRSSLGDNDNPNQQQFNAAYRKQLTRNEIKSSDSSNCLDQLSILVIPSTYSIEETNEEQFIRDEAKIEILTSSIEFRNKQLSELEKASVAYTAGQIEKKIITIGQFACDDCANMFNDNTIQQAGL